MSFSLRSRLPSLVKFLIIVVLAGIAVFIPRFTTACSSLNLGISFGLMHSLPSLVTMLSAAMWMLLLGVYIRFRLGLGKRWDFILLSLLIGGGMNLFERVVWGNVCDYISLPMKFMLVERLMFNIADIIIVLSVMYGIYLTVGYKEDVRK